MVTIRCQRDLAGIVSWLSEASDARPRSIEPKEFVLYNGAGHVREISSLRHRHSAHRKAKLAAHLEIIRERNGFSGQCELAHIERLCQERAISEIDQMTIGVLRVDALAHQ